MYMAKIQKVLHVADDNLRPTYDVEPLEKVHTGDDYNVFANERQHFKQHESINHTYVLEKTSRNVIFDSSDMCDNEGKADQNVDGPEDELVLLASLIANLKLDVDKSDKVWNGPRDFPEPVKAISLPQDVPSTSDRRLIELENQVQRFMEAHLARKSLVQVNKITSLCKICSGLHDTLYCIENLEQAVVDYVSSRTDKAGASQDSRLANFEADFKQQQSKMTNKIDTFWKAINDRMTGALPSDTEKPGESKIVIGEGKSWDIKRDDPDNRAHGDTKGLGEVDEEREVSKEEVKEEDDDP
ncbi:hypothetical protein Tco_0575309 [Tanacetum coccineum]